MSKKLLITFLSAGLMALTAHAQDGKTVLENAAKAIGATGLKSIQYSGSGYNFAVGQSVNPNAPWPRFNVKSYMRVINFDSLSSQEELVRTQGENPPRGGGNQPLAGEQRQLLSVSGKYAWNMTGNNVTPAPAVLEERLLQIWLTPHGFLKAAMMNNATVSSRGANGSKVTAVSFLGHGKFKVEGIINDQNLVEKVETAIGHPVLGDLPIVTTYSNYQDFAGVKFPTKIMQSHAGYPSLDISITQVQPNAATDIQVPESIRQAPTPPVRVEAQKLAEGVWYLAGGSHHSVAVEFKDHVVIIEGPQNEARSLAVIEEVKKSIPNKPIRYLVNTHHHFDHSGGIRTYAAEGATIVTHEINKSFYEKSFRAARTLSPDKLSQANQQVKIQAVSDKYVLTDGAQVVELHHIKGNTHNDGLLMAYLPKEKLLIEADVYTPPQPNTTPPATVSPFSMNLYDNIQQLKLVVDQIVPLHGRVVPMADFLKAIGKT